MKRKHLDILLLLSIVFFLVLVFRKFFFLGLLPIPYDILVGWYFPYTVGDWENYRAGIPFKGGLFAADVFRQMIPWKRLSFEMISQGEWPLWNPYSFSGEPLLANPQVTVFYPLTLLFFFIQDFDIAWSFYIFLSPVIASLGMYAFLRSEKLHPLASLIGGLAFALSGHMVSWMEWGVVTHSAVWLPYLLLAFNLWVRDNKQWGIGLLIFSTVATITGGYPQESAYALVLSGLYFLFLTYRHKNFKNKLIQSLGIGVFILIILAVQLIPTFTLFKQSALRGQTSEALFLRTRLDIRHAMTLFAPDYFGNRITNNYWADQFTEVDYIDANMFIGSAALFFCALLLFQKKKDPKAIFFLTIALSTFMLAVKSPVTFWFAKLHIPLLSTGVAAGILFLTVTCLAIASAYGANFFLSERVKIKQLFVLSMFYVLLTSTLFFVPEEFLRTALRNTAVSVFFTGIVFIFVSLVFLKPVSKKTRAKEFLLIIIILFSMLEYGRYTNKVFSFSEPDFSYPEHPLVEEVRQRAGYYRTIGFWDAQIATNLHTELKLFSTEGYNPLHVKHYQELVSASKEGVYTNKIARSDADVFLDNPETRNRFMQLASVKYVYARVTTPSDLWEIEPLKYDENYFELVWQLGRYKIYEFSPIVDRVQVFNQYEVIEETEQRINRLYHAEFNPQDTLILENAPELEISQSASGSAKIADYTPNRVVIETDTSNGASLLLLTDTYYPSWKAYIDGQETKIYKANQSFRAIILPEGVHTVEFEITWP